jgi:hypothetical protein
VKPNRAQEILFGPTLEAYLYGEHVGGALLSKTTVSPSVVCTDRAAALALREQVDMPVVWVLPCQTVNADDAASHGRPARACSRLATFQIGTQELAVSNSHGNEAALVTERLFAFAEQFDLNEPFTRVRGAIEEAQRGGR